MKPLAPRERRTVVLALIVLVPSLGWIYAGRPFVRALADATDRVTIERDALSRERAAVAEAARNPARKRFADSAMLATQARVFTGANDVAAGATLVSYLGEVARKHHVWLASAATRPTSTAARPGGGLAPGSLPAGVRSIVTGGRGVAPGGVLPEGLTALRVELRAESDFQGALDFLDALERGEKVVTVERLDIARVLRAGDEDRETLAVTATVVGYAMNAKFHEAPGGRGASPGPRTAPGADGARGGQ